MKNTDFDDHFLAIWRRALNLPSLNNLSASIIKSWANERGLNVEDIEEKEVGVFRKTRCIVLVASGKLAYFPKIPSSGDQAWLLHRHAADRDANLWTKMEWFSPLWIPNGKVRLLLAETENCSKERAIELFDYHTSTLYTLAFQAVCIAQILPQANSLREFYPLAREAYLAFYSGYRASSIAALIPTIEGAIARIISNVSDDLTTPDKINIIMNKAIEKAAIVHFGGAWIPREYQTVEYLFGQDERVFFFETFRRWLHNSFFKKTSEYDGSTWLNRHMFAHGESSSWQQSANFCRLVVALATIGVVESWHDESNLVSLFFPEMNDESTLLWQQARFQGETQLYLKVIEAQRYQEHGRLVPDMPTDDGVLLRKAILCEDCINDLVRPLRDAGWNVNMGEPDDRALYVKVIATAGEQKLTAALLYSCDTANDIYRNLEIDSNVILYRGAPYHQNQYAHGIKSYVGPVAGWQPPKASK